MNNWNRIWKPIVVLCTMCIVVTAALAAANQATAPVIEAATIAAENATRTALLPDADSFTEVDIEADGVSDVYTADNGAGAVITASAKGYGGDVVVMVAILPDGTIKQIDVTSESETKGIGSKVVGSSEYLARYEGQDASDALVLNEDVDALSGATISSRAVLNAVNAAIDAYNQIP